MCYNCGCQMPEDEMGNPDNITTETFRKAAAASGQSLEEALKNTKEMIEQQLAEGQTQ